MVWNEPNEAALLKRWFEHMREVGSLPCEGHAGYNIVCIGLVRHCVIPSQQHGKRLHP